MWFLIGLGAGLVIGAIVIIALISGAAGEAVGKGLGW